MRELPWLLLTIGIAGIAVVSFASGEVAGYVVTLVVAGLLISTLVAVKIARDVDRKWLPALLPAAFAAKMMGAAVRYYVVAEFYGYGDAFGYHGDGLKAAPVWRAFRFPPLENGSVGTQATKEIAGLLYAVVTPPMIGGFLLFAALSFIGMVCFYVAFRDTMPNWAVLPYFGLLFFLPTMVFWPSSVGKDALMVLGLGLLALGASRIFARRSRSGLVLVAAGALLTGLIRPHVLAIALGAILAAAVLARFGGLGVSRTTRVVLVGVALIAMVYVVPLAAARIGADEGLETFLENQKVNTAQGGSAVAGDAVRSPLDLPEATLRVLFRPLPNEASTPGLLFSALEGTALLLLTIWRLPTIWANRRIVRSEPYVIFSLAFTVAFVIAFSSILNLGILARQRSQIVPLLLTVLIGLGWRRWSDADVETHGQLREETNA